MLHLVSMQMRFQDDGCERNCLKRCQIKHTIGQFRFLSLEYVRIEYHSWQTCDYINPGVCGFMFTRQLKSLAVRDYRHSVIVRILVSCQLYSWSICKGIKSDLNFEQNKRTCHFNTYSRYILVHKRWCSL